GAGAASDLGNGTDDFMAGNDRKWRRLFRWRAAILGRFATIGMLVGPADTAHLHGDDHRVIPDLRVWKILRLDPARRDHNRCLDAVWAHASSRISFGRCCAMRGNPVVCRKPELVGLPVTG